MLLPCTESGLACFQQEVWETQRQAFEAAKQAGVETTEEVAFREHMERLLDADVVLVAYPVLSQEASTRWSFWLLSIFCMHAMLLRCAP